MPKNKHFIYGILILAIIGIVFVGGCVPKPQSAEEVKENPKIGDIITSPKLYEGKTVIIDGKYGGWGLAPEGSCVDDATMETRGDVMIYDETGCLYISSWGDTEFLYKEKEDLRPNNREDVGVKIQIKTKVRLINGKPIL